MEATIETNNSDEVNMLRIKLEIVEKELQLAINRAEKAESDIEQLKSLYKNKRHVENALPHSTQNTGESAMATTATATAETPTSLVCTHCGQSFQSTVSNASPSTSTASITSVACTLPPPPPPPMPNFKPIPVNLNRCESSLKDGITAFTLNNPRESGDNVSVCSNPDVKKSATGRFIRYCRDDGETSGWEIEGYVCVAGRFIWCSYVCKKGCMCEYVRVLCFCTNMPDAIVHRVYAPSLSLSLISIAKCLKECEIWYVRIRCKTTTVRWNGEKMTKLIKLCKNVPFFCRMLYTDSVKTSQHLPLAHLLLNGTHYTCVQLVLYVQVCFCLSSHFEYSEFKSNLLDISLFFTSFLQ